MAYANPDTGACPADHPVSLPEVAFEVYYTDIAGGPQYVLSSHGPYTMHGDFFAAWDPQVQNALVAACLNAGQDCINVSRDGGQLTAGDNSQIAITLADYSAKSTVVLPAPAKSVPAPSKSALALHCGNTVAPKPARRSTLVTRPAAAASPAATHSQALLDKGTVALGGGAVGLSLLGLAASQLRRRRRGQHDRRQRWQ